MHGYNSSYRNSEIKPKEKDQPLDTVSSIVWDPYRQDPGFIASSWDGWVRYYVIKGSNHSSSSIDVELAWSMFLQHPVLCCDIHPDSILFVGMATGDIAAINLQNNDIARIGGHDAPICGIYWIKDKGCLMSLGFDNLVRFWNINENSNRPAEEKQLPLKTHATSYDFPYLLIGSIESTVSIINLKNLPNVNWPRYSNDYIKSNLQIFSKLNCAKINAQGRKIAVGTVDGRSMMATFKQMGDKFTLDPLVSRSQKRGDTRTSLYGQVNCIDLGYANYQTFCLIGGTEDLSSFNISKRTKGSTYATSSSSTGACTAARLSPRLDFIAYATGTDWTKGIYELQTLKKPKICISRISQSDIKELTSR